MNYPIRVLKCIDSIFLVVCPEVCMRATIINSDRKVWPDTEVLLDRSPKCARNLEIETEW